MSDQAQRRLNALGKQLDSDASGSIPPIVKIASGSSSLRVEGKVVIITGKSQARCSHWKLNEDTGKKPWTSRKFKITNSTFNQLGANSPLGIGRATAHQLAESGARAIYLCDFDSSHLDTHKKEITTVYPKVEVLTREFDAADEAEVKSVVNDAVQRFGRLDVFFANAGVTGKNVAFTDFDEASFMSTMKTNTLR